LSVDRLDRVLARLVPWSGSAPQPLDREEVAIAELVAGAGHHRLVGVLGAAVAAGDLEVEGDEADLVARGHATAMAEVLLLEESLLDAIDILDEADIDHRLLKGSALAHTVYPDPSHRSFGDIDLLVRSADIDRAVAVLGDGGADRPIPALSADFDSRFAKSVTLRWRRDTELDLHRTLAPAPFGLRIVLEDLWAEPGRFDLAGVTVSTLSPELHLLNGAYHSVLGDTEPRLGNLRDLALLIGTGLDTDLVVETAARWQGQAVLARAIELVRSVGAPVGELGDWADRMVVTATDRRRLEAYGRRAGRFRRQAMATLAELGWRDRIAYARAVALPVRAHRRARKRSGSG